MEGLREENCLLKLSQDPMGFDAGDTNLYRYVGNNPMALEKIGTEKIGTVTYLLLSG